MLSGVGVGVVPKSNGFSELVVVGAAPKSGLSAALAASAAGAAELPKLKIGLAVAVGVLPKILFDASSFAGAGAGVAPKIEVAGAGVWPNKLVVAGWAAGVAAEVVPKRLPV